MPDEFQFVGGTNKQGQAHGKGTLTSPYGSVYEGEWENGDLNGYGTAKYHSGDHYEGEWKDGKHHGKGTLKSQNGSLYEGAWKNGKRHGKGQQYNGENGNLFKGEFRNDCFSTGTLHFSTGSHYVGGFDCQGYLHGRGKLTHSDGVIFEGEWANRKATGGGTVIHPDGKIEEVDDIASVIKFFKLKLKFGY